MNKGPKKQEPQDLAKLKRDLVEIEDLVYQVLFFAHHSSDRVYARVMITNLSRKILEFLQIEFKDIDHVFRHEHVHHNIEVHVARESPENLHLVLKKQGKEIKRAVSVLPKLCKDFSENKFDEAVFRQKIESQCSAILKLVGSEEHELGFAKGFVSKMGSVREN